MFDNPDFWRWIGITIGALFTGSATVVGMTAALRAYRTRNRESKLFSYYIGAFVLGYMFLCLSAILEIVLRLGHPFSWRFFTYFPGFILSGIALYLRAKFVKENDFEARRTAKGESIDDLTLHPEK